MFSAVSNDLYEKSDLITDGFRKSGIFECLVQSVMICICLKGLHFGDRYILGQQMDWDTVKR